MKKERDYHRQHHNRIAQEKNNLVTFIKRYLQKTFLVLMRLFFSTSRLKSHLSTYEPQLDELKTKYDSAVREKMLYKLERDKMQSELNALKLSTSTSYQSKTS